MPVTVITTDDEIVVMIEPELERWRAACAELAAARRARVAIAAAFDELRDACSQSDARLDRAKTEYLTASADVPGVPRADWIN